ncbi:MAG: transglycosylase family protein [Dermatophilaceae bacterium]
MRYISRHDTPRSPLLRGVGAATATVVAAAVGIGLSASSAQADDSVWDRVAQCEAGGNWAISTGNGFSGGLQFTQSSWAAAGGTAYASAPHLASREGQIAAGQRLLAAQGPGAWPACSIQAGLTSANGMGGGSAPVLAAARSAAAPKPAAPKPAAATRASATVTAKTAPAVATKPAATKPAATKPAAPKPSKGELSGQSTRIVQSWLGGDLSGRWDPQALSALQRKVGAPQTGKTDVQSVALVEKLIGAPASGLAYYTQPSLDKLQAYATAQLTSASLTSLTAAVEGGVAAPATVSLAATPSSYR